MELKFMNYISRKNSKIREYLMKKMQSTKILQILSLYITNQYLTKKPYLS